MCKGISLYRSAGITDGMHRSRKLRGTVMPNVRPLTRDAREYEAMRIIITIALLFGVVGLCTSSVFAQGTEGPQGRWQPYSSKSGRFTVRFPGTPAEDGDFPDNVGVATNAHLLNLHTRFGDYLVSYVDVPSPPSRGASKKFFDNAMRWWRRDVARSFLNEISCLGGMQGEN